jgi:hypothetical protein
MFGEFSRERHVVEPFDIPKEWARRVGVDYGWEVWAVIWLAIDQDQRVWLYREIWQRHVPEREQAKMILALEQAAGEVGVVPRRGSGYVGPGRLCAAPGRSVPLGGLRHREGPERPSYRAFPAFTRT